MDRRRFLEAGALAVAGAAAGCGSRRGSRYRFFTNEEADMLAVLCDQIIPPDDFPGAGQAGVVTYIDRQMLRRFREFQRTYRDELSKTAELCASRYGRPITALAPAEQLDVARTVERDRAPFFSLLVRHTMQGFYGSPRHGGNRDALSWRMLGVAEPPVRGRALYDIGTGGAA